METEQKVNLKVSKRQCKIFQLKLSQTFVCTLPVSTVMYNKVIQSVT